MIITLKTKKLYTVKNKDDILETHYRRYKLGFKGKNQNSLILFWWEDYCEILNYAQVIKFIF